MNSIRNFSIIAHIDHGKSTLADRMIQHAGLVSERDFREQILDSMDIERERGITIKSQTVTLPYQAKDGRLYTLNLIDTPGHVDFSYEVSRALASCEGVLLLIDAAQGVEAQTVANLYAALEHDLVIIPVINKIDLPAADIELTKREIETELGLDPEDAVLCSAKHGTGVDEILESVIRRLPPPGGDPNARLRALIFDAQFDPFRGTVVSIRVNDGSIQRGDIIRTMSNDKIFKVEELGVFRIKRDARKTLGCGEVGYVIAGIKTVSDTRIGDTITRSESPATEPLPGFKLVKPMVFSSLYPVTSDDYHALKDAIEKYVLNDASFTYEKDASVALGQGFRCGFLGLLHLEIVQERLEREYNQSLIMTVPSVSYRCTMNDGSVQQIDNPAHFPDPVLLDFVEEPYIRATLLMPERYFGAVMQLCRERRSDYTSFLYPVPGRIEMTAEMPLSEVLFDFYDRLKTITQGYGSFDYEVIGYRKSDVVKIDMMVNGQRVDALSFMAHRDRARQRAVVACERLEKEIPRHQFRIAIQGAIGGTIIARSTVRAFRKDVTAKCYGGDITRKRKLLEKQKAGKRRMKMVGDVVIPQSAFISVLKSEE
jgi:GTP-binding protein LepA